MRLHLPFGIRLSSDGWQDYISKEEYLELSRYAGAKKIRIEGFKRYKGDIEIIKQLLDDIETITRDFPLLLEGKKAVIVSLDENSNEDDFATTIGHIIYINAKLFNDTSYIKTEYDLAVSQGKFVHGTDYHAIIRHEIGHVVANIYNIDTMEVAQAVKPDMSEAEILVYVSEKLSLYAADYSDGREFISECFSAYYSGVENTFANEYITKCKEYIKGGN